MLFGERVRAAVLARVSEHEAVINERLRAAAEKSKAFMDVLQQVELRLAGLMGSAEFTSVFPILKETQDKISGQPGVVIEFGVHPLSPPSAWSVASGGNYRYGRIDLIERKKPGLRAPFVGSFRSTDTVKEGILFDIRDVADVVVFLERVEESLFATVVKVLSEQAIGGVVSPAKEPAKKAVNKRSRHR